MIGVSAARHIPQPPPFLHGRDRKTGAQLAGLAYEAKVQEHLLRSYGDSYIVSPWFEYRLLGEGKARWCQADGLLLDLDRGKIVVVEVKLKHTRRAEDQLFTLYIPVLTRMFPPHLWDLCALEVVRYFDPSEQTLHPVIHRTMPDESTKGDLNVLIHRPT